MNGEPLFEVSKLLRHASIQMTERYANLAPDHLHNAVENLGFSSQFHLTENLQQAVVYQNGVDFSLLLAARPAHRLGITLQPSATIFRLTALLHVLIRLCSPNLPKYGSH